MRSPAQCGAASALASLSSWVLVVVFCTQIRLCSQESLSRWEVFVMLERHLSALRPLHSINDGYVSMTIVMVVSQHVHTCRVAFEPCSCAANGAGYTETWKSSCHCSAVAVHSRERQL